MNIVNDLKKIKEKILSSQNIIISTHTNPDGDAIGSEIALYHLIKQLSRKVTIINDSKTPDNLSFLDNDGIILTGDNPTSINCFYSADLIIIVDLNDSKRLKSVQVPVSKSKAYKICIDHHIDPQDFADMYYVDTESSSTGQLIYDLICEFNDVKLNSEISTSLYAAIMTDTGSFRFPRTTPKVHRIIANLIENGANPVTIYDKIYNSNSMSATKILGEAMSGIKLYLDGILCLMVVTDDMFRRTGAKNEDIDNFVDKTLAINGVKIGILISNIPDKNEIRVSIRSKNDYSARELAVLFGGGGHFHAAGARLFDISLDDAKSKIIEIAAKLYL